MRLIHKINDVKFGHGSKLRTFYGYLTIDNKSFVSSGGGNDLAIIIDKDQDSLVYIIEAQRGVTYDASISWTKSQVLDWLNIWDTQCERYWIDRITTIRDEYKAEPTKSKCETAKWDSFFNDLGKILMTKGENPWSPVFTLDNLKFY